MGRLILAKLVICLLSVSIGLQVNAQQVSSADQSRLHVYLFAEFTKENNLKLNRVTRQGELSACELEFQWCLGSDSIWCLGLVSGVRLDLIPGISLRRLS